MKKRKTCTPPYGGTRTQDHFDIQRDLTMTSGSDDNSKCMTFYDLIDILLHVCGTET